MPRTIITRSLLLALLLAPAGVLADGKASYDKLCASCHGADGKGNPEKAKLLKIDPNILNLGRPEAPTKREELREILAKGKAKMPGYEKKLKADEIDPVLEYTIQLANAARGK